MWTMYLKIKNFQQKYPIMELQSQWATYMGSVCMSFYFWPLAYNTNHPIDTEEQNVKKCNL